MIKYIYINIYRHIYIHNYVCIYIILFIFGYAESLLLCLGLFSTCGKLVLLSSCNTHASNYSGFFCCGTLALGHMEFQ